MTAVKSGLMIIDQHRAHLRVLYEEYLEAKAADPDNEAGHRDLSFEEYIRICQTVENGTLEPLN